MPHQPISVAIAAEHDFMRKGISQFVSSFAGFKIIHETNNGNSLLPHIYVTSNVPQICILDINTAKISEFEQVTSNIKNTHPNIKILAFLSEQNKLVILRMLKAGADCLLPNNCDYKELEIALQTLIGNGTYYPKFIASLINNNPNSNSDFSYKECKFLSLCCSELTYKEIADKMTMSLRAVETLREGLFKKLDTVSRTGLVVKALKDGIISI